MNHRFLMALSCFIAFKTPLWSKEEGKDMVVIAPVADVRAQPTPHGPQYINDPLQETQVLKGERVKVLEKKGAWSRVECPEQPEFTHNSRWQGYPGWIESKALAEANDSTPMLQQLALTETSLRERIVKEALRHIGSPYLWGGRSLHVEGDKQKVTGVDCSGLVNWSFRQVGRVIPRDAHEQFMKARRVEPADLKAADLIFLAKTENPEKIVHVALYKGEGELVEAPQTGEKVHREKIKKRFGSDLAQLKNGQHLKDRVIYFGSFFPEGE